MVEEKKYRFTISKNKEYKKKYNVLKKEPTPIEKLKELFTFEKEEGKGKTKKDIEKSKKKGSLVKTLGIIAVIFLLVSGGLLFYIFSSVTPGPYVPPAEKHDMGIIINPVNYGMANIMGHNVFTPYLSFNAEVNRLDEVDYYIETTTAPLFDRVYVLNSNREQSTRYYEFLRELRSSMSLEGITVNEIELEALKNLPEKSSAVLVVPTGYLPVQFVQEERSVRKIAESGMHVIYIGYGFDSGLIDEERGRIFPGEYSVDIVSNILNIRKVGAGGGVNQLKIRSPGVNYAPLSDRTRVSNIYGNIPMIKWVGGGSLIILPESLDSGWTTGKEAADDVSQIIKDKSFLKVYNEYIEKTPLVRKTIGENNTINDIIITEGKADIDEVYIRLVIRGYTIDRNGNKVFQVAEMYNIHEKNEIKGTLWNDRFALSRDLSGKLTDLTANLNEERNRFPNAVPIFLRVYSSKGDVVHEEQFGTSYILPVEFTFNTQFNPRMSPGTYILKLQDSSPTPYTFAKSVIEIPTVELRPITVDWRENVFRFVLFSRELGDSEQYTRSLEGTEVIINDRIRKTVQIVRLGDQHFAEVRVPEGLAENEEHVFVFTAQEGLVFREVSTIDRAYYENWWFWVGLIGALLPVGIGILLRAKDKPVYSIDIPEFEVKKVNKIKIKKSIFINLFDKINQDYNWKYMPLRTKEIKNGFRKITYMGRPVIIGDYNLSVILEKLKNDGEVKSYMDLYLLKSWEEQSGHDYRYLAMFRKVRDKFLNLAIPFTNINERKDCDIFVKSYRGEFKFVLGEGEKLHERIYKSLGSKEKVLLVFKDDEDKMKFNENITMMGGGEGIKIALINGKLIMVSIKEIPDLIK